MKENIYCPLCSYGEIDFFICENSAYGRCPQCELVWLRESCRLSLEQERARYLLHDNKMELPSYRRYLSRLCDAILPFLTPGSCGLDFGCGPVEGMAQIMGERGFAMGSYDPHFFPNGELLNNRYDFVLCSEVAEHFILPAKEFALLDRILRPGGVLGFSTSLLTSLKDFPSWQYRRDPTHTSFYTEKSLGWIETKFHWKLLLLEGPLWVFRKESSS